MATSSRNAELQAQYNAKKENLQAVSILVTYFNLNLVARGEIERS